MSNDNLERHLKITGEQTMVCPVCRHRLYITDRGNHETTFHCSSAEARFWDFDRGTIEQINAKKHWDESRLEVFENADGTLTFVFRNQQPPAENNRAADRA